MERESAAMEATSERAERLANLHGVITEQLHPAVYDDFATIFASVAQLAGPVTFIAKLRTQLGKFDREFGLQQRVADAPDRLIRRKPVKSFSPGKDATRTSVRGRAEHVCADRDAAQRRRLE
jgi:hypothetical protein